MIVPGYTGGEFVIDDDDAAILADWRWYILNPTLRHHHARYVVRSSGNAAGGVILLHREIMQPQRGYVVDHINGDTLDNRRSNLRIATTRQNNARVHNRFKKSASGYRGVYGTAYSTWVALISIGNKRHYLGTFSEPSLAAKAFDDAAVAARGEFAILNFPRT